MLATSTRQPSRPNSSQRRDHAAHARLQLRIPPVELRQRRHTEPRLVAVRDVRVEVEETALRRVRVRACGAETTRVLAGVVERQVADQPDPARLGRARQRGERLVAAEHRVDAVEARRVVAVVRPGREDRSQVDDVRPQTLDVVEVLLDAGQVAAVPLAAASPARARSVAPPTPWAPPTRAARRRGPSARTGPGRSRRRRTRGASRARSRAPGRSRRPTGPHAGRRRCPSASRSRSGRPRAASGSGSPG